MASEQTAYQDSFVRDRIPAAEAQAALSFTLPDLNYPARLNGAVALIADALAAGLGDKLAVIGNDRSLTYNELDALSNRIAHVLVEDAGLKPGNRVLMRGPNNAMMTASWFGVLKAGGIAVATMPLLRAVELKAIIDKSQSTIALCDSRFLSELELARAEFPVLARVLSFGAGGELDALAAKKPDDFTVVDTAADDVALLAFTSGTTGKPKGCIHFHRDILAMTDTFGRHVLKPTPDDVFTGSPPIAFTFGLGALIAFPLRFGATTVLLEQPSPDAIMEAIHKHGVTTLFTAPTMYKGLLNPMAGRGKAALRKCVSAGEHLPKPVWEDWHATTGIKIIDGIGSTEMIHIFISSAGDDIRPGATGKAVPGYEACVLDDKFQPLPPGNVGKLAVRGPTACRYLDDPRQQNYARNGWNVTGDSYLMDKDGYFWFQARDDDMIVSAGYNIGGPEVEEALLAHAAVAECAVIASPDPERGQIVKALVVLNDGHTPGEILVKELQDFVKATIAPYKYPRAVDFVGSLPKTETGKIQRFKLRQLEIDRLRQMIEETK
ncbi:benzoate-CoA ligase family protein [Govanella unica]|uniref:Benzoate-CoA ligase family protein n=1 Tax=Govanella unica TaxID=2975056 RepID=A0A9X3TZ11_9PROT|nr:benzoate-CoA ligase family protein [Govania unica]MDA5194002.1 benzoate-CoA ligase family protein [Govania unica]